MQRSLILMLGLWVWMSLLLAANPESPAAADAIFQNRLQQVTTMWQTLKSVHPAWEKLSPICIAYGDNYYLYNPSEEGLWNLARIENRPGQVPETICAAYPLDFADNQIACVIDPSFLVNQKELIIVFHEFVHCFQFNTCESELKGSLKVNREAMKSQNWMWELNYNFPYADEQVADHYLAMIAAAERGDFERVSRLRSELKSRLSETDWEYLSWQEFKEGMARYLENELKLRYGYDVATSSHDKPLNRVIFYEGGEKLIRLLGSANPELITNLPLLWQAMH